MVLLVSDIFESSFISLHPYDQPWCKSVNGVEFAHSLPFTPEIVEENNNEHWTGHVYNDQSKWYTGIPMAHVASDSVLELRKYGSYHLSAEARSCIIESLIVALLGSGYL